jgi:hypothetical protein
MIPRFGLLLGLLMAVGGLHAADAARLNVVLMVADDLGAHDLASSGSRFHETPRKGFSSLRPTPRARCALPLAQRS